ncbi:hypothetical protein AACH10_15290 [Ideonella sp. DXS22W]|uniref:Uncharacterized protein n=1 Tax=Pseudaquabacterium inlustre TaxID=2984192 RepID=A0ABU9CID1_9BURK
MNPPPVDRDAASLPDDPAVAAQRRYAKTEAGRAEVRGRALALSRQARNLLLIIEPGRAAADWMAMVQGCGPAELQALREAGLIAPATPAAPVAGTAAPAPEAAAPAAGTRPTLAQTLAGLGYRTLYDRITAEARPVLGLIKGYRLVLDVERCNGPDELRALALQFVEQVRVTEGPAAALALAGRLTAPEPAANAGAPG